MSRELRPWTSDERVERPYPERERPEIGWADEAGAALIDACADGLRRLRPDGRAIVAACASHRARLGNLDAGGLRASADALRAALVRHGFRSDLVAAAFAHVREATRRHLGYEHHPVQLIGGAIMLRGRLAEMQTGEGKTITAMLPAAAAALAGMPVHVITVNDYLAERDAETLRPIYSALGLSVGIVQHGQDPPVRRAAYAADIAYCTNKELAFDYLRDRIAARQHPSAQRVLAHTLVGEARAAPSFFLRGLWFGIIDEADSILIDEARTPLILSAPSEGGAGNRLLADALALAAHLKEGADFAISAAQKLVHLTARGEVRAKEIAASGLGGEAAIWQSRRAREELLTQALSALHVFRRDHQYILADGKVQIVDEFTGRVMADRKWQRGLQQLIEIKEGCESSEGRETLAQITYQRFFRRYLWLAGMSGTAWEVRRELARVYGLQVARVPTHRPNRRRTEPTRVYLAAERRWDAVVASARAQAEAGRPTLIGTRSVAASELVAGKLEREGLRPVILNARQDKEEARAIAGAGLPGAVTVATNIAGRGTDIRPSPEVVARGGLHVILTEFHESARIDRQLVGRTGRQGDPGSCQSLVAIEDELFRAYVGRLATVITKMCLAAIVPPLFARLLKSMAQGRAERANARVRRATFKRDHQLDRALGFTQRTE